MSLKSAYDIAFERFGIIAPIRHDDYEAPAAVIAHKDSIMLDLDSPYESEHKDFFSTASPSKVVGSRAISNSDKKEALEGVRINKVKNISIHYEGPMLSHSGYSTMNRAVIDGLIKAGVNVKTHITPTHTDVSEKVYRHLRNLEDSDVPPNAPKISGLTVPQSMGHSGKRILYTMMETSEGVHPEYVGKLNLSNEVWVPSSYLADILIKDGLHADVFEMPLGVDTSLFKPGTKPMKLSHDAKGFVFLSVFNWGFRKGWDILLKTYLEEFSFDDDVTLMMSVKTFGNPKGISDIVSQINNLKAGLRKHPSKLPHMMLHTSSVDERDMPSLYAAADAFVLFSRGEGQGLPFLESGACGLPVIATNVTSQSTFLNSSNAYLVDPDGYTRHQITDPAFGNMAKLCRFYEGQLFPKFGKTAMDRAKACMREVFEGYGEAKKRGEQLRKDICNNLTWNHAINRITSRLEDL